jgi:phenylalanyl-tRNA synthetase beta chain
MRVSYRWLSELVPGLTLPPHELGDRLTMAGLEVEGREELGAGLEPVVIAEVTKVEPHPQRDKLSLVTVSRGGGITERVVCGAPNVPAPGGLVLLAPLGTTLPGAGFALTGREIGGVRSEGMLCSEAELGLGDDASGILVLPPGFSAPGTPLLTAVPTVRDTIFELGVTPNRADALSHVGVAREVAALLDLPFALPPAPPTERVASAKLPELVAVDNLDQERCPRYGARVVLGVTVAPSPLWMQWRLRSLGIRPISNVVDVTNWLLYEFGHPMHAFDLDRVRGHQIVIRRARGGEPFVTLDGVGRTLDDDDLVICDGVGPTALAGVMGGQDSEIRDTTSRVLLECAYFAPRGIRRTSRRHALSTDSSYRFERGIDWAGISRVLDHAAAWLAQIAGGEVVPGEILAGDALPVLRRITLRQRRLDALLGQPVAWNETQAILGRLGFAIERTSGQAEDGQAEVLGASHRPDVEREVDLIEEVARVRGLDTLPTVLPPVAPQAPRKTGKLERDISELGAALGLSEAVGYSFVSRRELEVLKAPEPVVTLQNPLSEERSVMRTSLLPGLLEALGRARRRGERNLALFATGARFLEPELGAQSPQAEARRPRRPDDVGVLPAERPAFAALLAGTRPAHLARPEFDIYDAKGLAVELVERVTGRRAGVRWVGATPDTRHLHPRTAAEIVVDEARVGLLGGLHPDVVDALDLDGAAEVVELDLGALETLEPATPRYRPIPKLPSVVRDISLEVPGALPAGEIEQAIATAAGELGESVELIDLFEGKPVAPGHRSLTFRVVYRDPMARVDPDRARTLTDKEVDLRHEAVRKAMQAFGARERG